MPEMQFDTVIHRPIEDVFALIADLPNYDRWLSPSSLYKSVTEYSDLPVRAGTRYVDAGTSSRMTGAVTTFEPPTRLSFRQETVTMLGGLTIEIRYTLAAEGDGTHLMRQVNATFSGAYGLLQPVVLRAIRKENERILATMKAYLEKGD